MNLSEQVMTAKNLAGKREPLWTGPDGEGPNGGVTQGLLGGFLVCRERFRLRVVEGLKLHDTFNHRLEYGNMWHICEEIYSSELSHFGEVVGTTLWAARLSAYAKELCKRYPLQQVEIDKWYNVCRVQFPLYLEYWSRFESTTPVPTPLLQEYTFDIPYSLPSGRKVRLRGKWDGVVLKGNGLWLVEHKTKSEIDQVKITRQLKFDLQTMLYLTAFSRWADLGETSLKEGFPSAPLRGVNYNVIRRPLSGGKGTIVQHKPSKSNPLGETKQHYYLRLADVIKEDASNFFMRWEVEVTARDVEKFRQRCLDPLLEQLCDWWTWVSGEGREDPFYSKGQGIHWRHPFGIYNPMDDGGFTDVDRCLETGSEVGLQRTNVLFPELKG